MIKQISLDAWQVAHLTKLLQQGSKIVKQTNRPIILYRQTLEESDESYEEIVCSLTTDYIIEQLVISGSVLVPTFRQQYVYKITDYPQIILKKSKERFLNIIDTLEQQLK